MTTEEKNEKARIYRRNNPEKIKASLKKYADTHKDKIKVLNKAYRESHKEEIKKYMAIYRESHKDKIKEYSKKHGWSKKTQERRKVYREKNRDKINKNYRERIKADNLFRLSVSLRARTRYIFKKLGLLKNVKTEMLLGVSWETAKSHIESGFQEGMTWANYGEWHIDHIVPLASAKNEQDLYKLCNYKNLQPLWALENRKKGAKL